MFKVSSFSISRTKSVQTKISSQETIFENLSSFSNLQTVKTSTLQCNPDFAKDQTPIVLIKHLHLPEIIKQECRFAKKSLEGSKHNNKLELGYFDYKP